MSVYQRVGPDFFETNRKWSQRAKKWPKHPHLHQLRCFCHCHGFACEQQLACQAAKPNKPIPQIFWDGSDSSSSCSFGYCYGRRTAYDLWQDVWLVRVAIIVAAPCGTSRCTKIPRPFPGTHATSMGPTKSSTPAESPGLSVSNLDGPCGCLEGGVTRVFPEIIV